MSWELFIAICALAVLVVVLAIAAIVKFSRKAYVKGEEPAAEQSEEPVLSEEETSEKAEEPVKEEPVKEETAEEETQEKIEEVVIVEETVEEAEEEPKAEEVKEVEEKTPEVPVAAAKEEVELLRAKPAPFGKEYLEVNHADFGDEELILIGGDDDLVINASSAEVTEIAAAPVEEKEVIVAVDVNEVIAPAGASEVIVPAAVIAKETVVIEPVAADATVDASGSFGTRLPFKTKMLGAEEKVQNYYDIINNEFLSYRNVHGRVSIAGVSYRLGRDLEAKITYRGKTMKLHLNLNLADYEENVYHQKDYGDIKAYAEVPFTVKVKSDRALKNALALIAELFNKLGVQKKTRYTPVDSIALLMGIESKPVKPAAKAAPAPAEEKQTAALVTEEIAATQTDGEGANGSFGTRIPFKDKLLGAEGNVQDYYDTINNAFLSLRNVHGRVSIAGVSYRFGRDLVAKITYRGKTMKLHLNLNVADFDQNVYHQKDYGDIKAYAEVPFTVKVKSDRGLNNALSLIDALCDGKGIERKTRFIPVNSIEELKN